MSLAHCWYSLLTAVLLRRLLQPARVAPSSKPAARCCSDRYMGQTGGHRTVTQTLPHSITCELGARICGHRRIHQCGNTFRNKCVTGGPDLYFFRFHFPLFCYTLLFNGQPLNLYDLFG